MLLEPVGGPLRLPEFGKSLLTLAVNQTTRALMLLLVLLKIFSFSLFVTNEQLMKQLLFLVLEDAANP